MGVGLAVFVRLQAWGARAAYVVLGVAVGVVACGYFGEAGSKSGPELLVTLVGAAFPVAAAIGISHHQELKKRSHQAAVLWAGARHIEKALIEMDSKLFLTKDLIHPRDADDIRAALNTVRHRFDKFIQFSGPLADPDVPADWRDTYQDVFETLQIILDWCSIDAAEARQKFQAQYSRDVLHSDVDAAFRALTRYPNALGNPLTI